ncbi:MAG TPA: glycosyltransferase family 4 protein [Methanotrichaceae archaeon]|nr:glycosyltransferase family 4 protein [Methanotrichaceae archaeon]
MKIAYFSTEYPPLIYGGLGVYVDNISRELASLGQRVSVFAWGDGKAKKYEDFKGVEAFRETPVPMRDGLEIFLSSETKAWGDGLSFLLDLISYNQLSVSKALEEGPYDLCVAQDWLGLPAAMAAREKGVPMIYHVHGLEIGRSSHPNPQLVELEKKGALVADLVITVSEAMKQQLEGLGVPEEKIRACYHGVDADFFDPDRADPKKLQALREKYGFGDEDQVILFVGRLEPVKGVAQLLQAMPIVVEKHPNARLLIVGKGSLEALVKEAAEHSGVVTLVTDFLDPEEKMYHYALADLCVFPSHYEPFGIVALEAAAMARPAVVGASGTSGLKEIVENPASKRPTGVHMDGRRPEDIAWGINLALQDPERLKAWGENARRRVLERFTWDKAAEQTLAIYEEVVARRS